MVGEVERLHAEFKAPRIGILLQISKLYKRMGEALGGAHVQASLIGNLRKTQVRPCAVENAQDPERLLNRLNHQRITLFRIRAVFLSLRDLVCLRGHLNSECEQRATSRPYLSPDAAERVLDTLSIEVNTMQY